MSSGLDECPKCKANLIGGEIPEKIRDQYGGTYWKREISIIEKDRTVKWKCPDCGHEWKV